MQSVASVSSFNLLTSRVLIAAAVAGAFFSVSVPWAQAADATYCPQISQNLRRGMTDAVTRPVGQITELQKFLASYYGLPSEKIVVGVFGPITRGYVMDFQERQNIEATGNVATLTRRAIAEVCGGSSSTTTPIVEAPSIVSFSGPSTLAVKQEGVWTISATNTITAYHIDWRDGEEGGNDNFGGNRTSLTHHYNNPGTYTIVLAARGPGGRATTTASVTVTGPAAPSIVSFTGPSTLTVGEEGVWTINATNTITGYHIDWRDGQEGGNDNFGGTRTTLTHHYNSPGMYTIVLAARGPGGRATTTASITVNPIIPVVTIEAGDNTTSEGNSGAFFRIIRSRLLANDFPVNVAVSGTAVRGADYNFSGGRMSSTTSNVVVIPAGESSVRVTVDSIEDKLVEGSETVKIALVAGSAYALGTSSSATVTITDDEVPTDATAPAVSITAPAANASVSGTVNIAAGATDAVGVAEVRFYVDGTRLRTDLSAPYLAEWNTLDVANGPHALAAVAVDKAGNAATSTIMVTVANPDTREPVVSVTAPKDGAKVSGTVAITADASDNVGVVGVQFKINRVNIGAEDTTAPYAIEWNSREVAKGSYNITATARDAAGNTKTSAAHTVNVSNSTASVDYAGMLASAAAAPFSLLVDQLTDLLVYAGIGQ